MTGKELVKLLERNGFYLDHVTGSHHIMRKGSVTVPVPVHGKAEVPKGTAHAILKKAGLK
jgi:predicted RNA binding protein YcfA (HicA-like mRNA interferase family)